MAHGMMAELMGIDPEKVSNMQKMSSK